MIAWFAASGVLALTPGARATQSIDWPGDAAEQILVDLNQDVVLSRLEYNVVTTCPGGGVVDTPAEPPCTSIALVPEAAITAGQFGTALSNAGIVCQDPPLVDDHLVARTRPQGGIGPGSYALVIDECLNGVYDPEDAIFENALDVLAPWPMEGRRGSHVAAGPIKGPLFAPQESWSYVKDVTPGTPQCCSRSSPVVSGTGSVYVGSNTGHLWAFDALSGAFRWAFATSPLDFVDTSPAIAPNGRIYFGGRNRHLYALNADGSLYWDVTLDAGMIGAPVLRDDVGLTVYVGTLSGRLYAYGGSGNLLWSYPTGNQIYESPAVGGDGGVFVGNLGGSIFAVNSGGTLRWSRNLLTQFDTTSTCPGSPLPAFVSSPAWSPDGGGAGTVYVALSASCPSFSETHGHVIALDADDGTVRWAFPADHVTGAGFQGGVAIDGNGAIYAAGALRSGAGQPAVPYLFELAPSGGVTRQTLLPGISREGPILGGDGTIYVATQDIGDGAAVVALRSGGELWRYPLLADPRVRPAIGMNGALYFTADDARIHALGGLPSVELRALELAQHVQSWRNSVPLVSQKTTFARAHLDAEGGYQQVKACLRGYRGGLELLESPLEPENLGGVMELDPLETASNRRTRVFGALEFRLPPDWTQDGTTSLSVERQALDKTCSQLRTDPPDPLVPLLACREPADAIGAGVPHDCSVDAVFTPVPPFELRIVGLRWTDLGGALHTASDAQLLQAASKTVATFPIAGLPAFVHGGSKFFLEHRMIPGFGPAPTDDEALLWLNRIRAEEGCGVGCRVQYYGLIPDAQGSGVAWQGSFVGVGGYGSFDGSDAYIPSHEIAHGLGHYHTLSRVIDLDQNGIPDVQEDGKVPGPCYEAPVALADDPNVPDFPYIVLRDLDYTALRGPIDQGDDRKAGGIDAYPTPPPGQPAQPFAALDPEQETAIMSYCFEPEMGFADTDYAALRAAIVQRASGPAPSAAADPPADYLVVAGSINLSTDEVVLAPLSIVYTDSPPPPPEAGSYSLELRDAGGGLLTSLAFRPRLPEDSPAGAVASFVVGLPSLAAARQILVKHGAATLFTRIATANTPTVAVVSPNGGEALTGANVQIAWTSSDPDGAALTHTVQYSADGGLTWETLALDLATSPLVVARASLRGTSQGRIRVRAQDGFHSASDVSNANFTVANSAPLAEIVSPLANQTFTGSQRVSLQARVVDRELGAPPAANLTWSSSRNGALGTGPELGVLASALAEGLHTITLSASDGAGGQSQRTVQIQVLRVLPDADLDGVADAYDNCPAFQNADQADADRDGIGDACDGITAVSDLRLVKSDSPDPVAPGAQVTYALAVTNLGPDAAGAVQLLDQAPAGFSFASGYISGAFTQANCNIAGSTFTCAMGGLASGATGTLHLVFTTSASGMFTNSASVSSSSGDPISTNNASSQTTTVGSPDEDGDGVPDASDNCRYRANPGQQNANGDAAGDACQCGDLTSDGLLSGADVAALRAHLTQQSPLSATALERCSVRGSSTSCDVADAAVLRRALESTPLAPGIALVCSAYTGP